MLNALDRIAGVRRARVAVIDRGRLSRYALPCGVALLRAVARVAVGTRRPRSHRHMPNALSRVARVRRARVAVIDHGRLSRHALPCGTALFRAVARIAVGTRRPYSRGRVLAHAIRTGILRARVTVITVCRSADRPSMEAILELDDGIEADVDVAREESTCGSNSLIHLQRAERRKDQGMDLGLPTDFHREGFRVGVGGHAVFTPDVQANVPRG
jgi:hypothetical protein